MFLQRLSNLKYIFSTIRSSFLPAFFLLCALLYFYAVAPFPFETALIIHFVFLGFATLALAILSIINRTKPFFTLMIGIICYLSVNSLKTTYGTDFVHTTAFQTLCLVLPINLIIFYFLPPEKLNTTRTKYIILALLAEIVLWQHVHFAITSVPHINILLESMPLWAVLCWSIVLIVMAIDISFKNSILNTGLFYMSGSLFMGLIYADTPSGLSLFFLSFASIAVCAVCIDLYHRYHYDYLENVGSTNAYLTHAHSKFPFKYTIVLFSIDNAEKIQKAIGVSKYRSLEQMIVNKILALSYDLSIYRYNENELIAVFKNENARHTKTYADEIRHAIAISEFVFSDGKSIKITISVCVSEKTRKDLSASEVTDRAHNALNKGHHFNCNITMVA